MQRRIDQITTNGQPDRDKAQSIMRDEFIMALLLRAPGVTPERVVEEFGKANSGILNWLGESRQGEILRDAQESTGIDLSHFLVEIL